MLKNYFRIALRNLIRNKSYSVINIIGLSIGIASCLLIFLFIQDELSFDRYHENSDQIYRVYRDFQSEDRSMQTLATSNLLAPTLQQEIPEIVASVRISKRFPEVMVAYENEKFYEQKFFFTDPSIFNVFSFNLAKGNVETALSRPFTIVLSEEMAHKYFGNKDPIGKNIVIRGSWGPDEYEVTGVLENTPHNSHFSINFLTSFETLRSKTPNAETSFESWRHVGSYTYVLLNPEVNLTDISNKLDALVKRHQPESIAAIMQYKLQPLTGIHLYSSFDREIEPNSDVRYLYIFGSIAFLILFVAGINYMNLATARSSDRAMEVGIRKTLGAQRFGLIKQFLSESFVFSLISMLLALLWVEIFLPLFANLTGKPLSFDLFDPFIVSSLVGITLLIGFIAGLYPSFVLSKFNPSSIFSGATGGRKKSTLRNALVVFQFTTSIILIISTLVITYQMDHIRDKRLGLSDETIVSIFTGPGTEFRENYSAFKNELLSHTSIQSVTHINPNIPSSSEQDLSLQPEGFDSRININTFTAGEDFLNTLEVPLIEGLSFNELTVREEDENTGETFIPVLINETAAHEWGWKEPIGKTFEGFSPQFRVVGVVKDFHYRSLKERIAPLIIHENNYSVRNVLIRINTENLRQSMSFIENTWAEIGPGTPFNYAFLDDQFDSMYKAEDRLAEIFRSFTFLAIIIACLGLFGLAAFSAERRTKEIGIRKVMGASIANIVSLLSKDFVKLVILGFVIAIPIAWYAMNQWLADFAYRIEIGPGIFALAGGAALVIALLTVSWQSIKAAVANPVDSLRSE
ncbi:MAG TPA: ABC transporter permease [Gracilimonas sp.]|uniref:ABC transporter permease n=1 Tax=Gracilimonas sp. TaxID=1974203 RepID=UPI002D93A0A6|nr:ABC transporter permease [Gracilimonas sp.]